MRIAPSAAWLCTAGMLCWLTVTIVFGNLIGSLLDFRIVIFSVLSVSLMLFGLRGAMGAGKQSSGLNR